MSAVSHPIRRGSLLGSDPAASLRSAGAVSGIAGLALAGVALIANLAVAADSLEADRAQTLAWTFGLTTTGLAALKVGIALTLIGILLRIRDRIDAVRSSIPALAPTATRAPTAAADVDTPHGPAARTSEAPGLLPIHVLARRLWAPMLAMGAMLVAAGFAVSVVQAGSDLGAGFVDLGAWAQGTQFLGEGLLLAGISFLLGTILGELRRGGGEVQEALGVTVWTLRMPWSAKAFIGLMAAGVMAAMAQFVLYVVATVVDDPSTWLAVLGPLREVALGLVLSGIVLALYTVGTVLGFQSYRLRTLVRGKEQS